MALVYEQSKDIGPERDKLRKQLVQYETELRNAQRQLENQQFLSKAPEDIVNGVRWRAEELSVLVNKTRAALEAMEPRAEIR